MGAVDPAAELAGPPTASPRKRRRAIPRWLWISALIVTVFIVLPLAIYGFGRLKFMVSYKIPSGAMQPTLQRNSLVLGDRLPYMLGDPERGDIAVFKYPKDPSLDYVKRVIGLPGDLVEVRDGQVFINEVALDEPYISEPAYASFGPETVPDDHYFVLGDNRNHSSDSRVWGYVPRDHFESRIIGHR